MASLARRDPFTLYWPDWLSRGFDYWWPERMLDLFGRSVKVEEFIQDGNLLIRAELPGIDPDRDVEISVHNGMLHIKGERSEHKEETGKASYRSEFRYGMFERLVPLPPDATDKDVQATYRDGLLEIRIPMAEAQGSAIKVPVQRVS